MTPLPAAFQRILDAWNEQDPAAIRAHVDGVLPDGFVFVDPTIETRGIDAFVGYIRQFRVRYPGARVSIPEGVDAQGRVYRYRWEVAIGTKVISRGFDVAELDEAGRLCRVVGFFGPPPRDWTGEPA